MDDERRLVADAKKLYAEGRLDESEALFQRLTSSTNFAAIGLCGVGMIRLSRGDLASAAPLFEEALQHSDVNADAHYGSGVVAEKQGNFEQAVSHYHRALSLNPKHTGATKRIERLTTLRQKRRDDRVQAPSESDLEVSQRGDDNRSGNVNPTGENQSRQTRSQTDSSQASIDSQQGGITGILQFGRTPEAKLALRLVQKLTFKRRAKVAAFLTQFEWIPLILMVIIMFVTDSLHQASRIDNILFEKISDLEVIVVASYVVFRPLYLILRGIRTKFDFRDAKIIMSSGVFGRTDRLIEIMHVGEYKVRRTFLQSIFGQGSIILTIEERSKSDWVVLTGVARYAEMRTMIEDMRELTRVLRTIPEIKGVVY
jgi:hypothetical protein